MSTRRSLTPSDRWTRRSSSRGRPPMGSVAFGVALPSRAHGGVRMFSRRELALALGLRHRISTVRSSRARLVVVRSHQARCRAHCRAVPLERAPSSRSSSPERDSMPATALRGRGCGRRHERAGRVARLRGMARRSSRSWWRGPSGIERRGGVRPRTCSHPSLGLRVVRRIDERRHPDETALRRSSVIVGCDQGVLRRRQNSGVRWGPSVTTVRWPLRKIQHEDLGIRLASPHASEIAAHLASG